MRISQFGGDVETELLVVFHVLVAKLQQQLAACNEQTRVCSGSAEAPER